MTEKRRYPLKQIYFYLTSACNLRCSHCWIGPVYRPVADDTRALDFNLFTHIIGQARSLGLSGVKLTGGEPLMHPEIGRFIAFVRQEGLRLTVETNGILCTPELAREMGSNRNASVSVSLDGADAGTHDRIRGVKGAFEGALTGIRNLVDAGIRPQIIMTVMRKNGDQLEQMVRLAESLGAGSVKFNVLQPSLKGQELHDRGEGLSIEEYLRLGEWVERDLCQSTRLPLVYHHPAAFRPLSRIFGKKGGAGPVGCGILHIIGVLSNGSYGLCGIGEHVPELVFGHAADDPLERVWQSNGVLSLLREGLPDQLEGVCAGCLMKHLCLGSCVAQNYYSAKRLSAPFWYCAAAEEKGLFPPQRLARNPEEGAGSAGTESENRERSL